MKYSRMSVVALGMSTLAFSLVSGSAHGTSSQVSARILITKLRVATEHNNGYQRDLFTHWVDADGDGCDTRKEVLWAEAVIKPKESGRCTLTGGKWRSLYDRQYFTGSSGLDIDHMVPLAEAWASGAYRWTSATRQAFANDLGYARSLIAVSASSNRSKSASDPWLWMPSNSSYRCQYINDWVAIKYRWNLAIDTTEKRDLVNKLRGCSGHTFVLRPTKASVRIGSSGTSSSGSGAGSSSGSTQDGNDPRFSYCSVAKAAGYGPYYRGKDVEYSWYRDGDSDGITCE